MNAGNLTNPRWHGTDALLQSPAFICGFGDAKAGRPFLYPVKCRGPNNSRRSAEIAYERGRHFAALWHGPIDIPAMRKELDRLRSAGLVI